MPSRMRREALPAVAHVLFRATSPSTRETRSDLASISCSLSRDPVLILIGEASRKGQDATPGSSDAKISHPKLQSLDLRR